MGLWSDDKGPLSGRMDLSRGCMLGDQIERADLGRCQLRKEH